MNSIELLKKIIDGCENVVNDFKDKGGSHEVYWLAKEVKKDCLQVIRAIQVEQGRIE